MLSYDILFSELKNLPGWRTNRKIVVIESDDWGSIRMPSRIVYEELLGLGYEIKAHPYEKYDSLASEEDLSALYRVLQKYRDKKGNHPVITAYCIVANPDFEKIEKSGFKEYFYEPFPETLKKYKYFGAFDLWKQGLDENIFVPQFHGREHINVAAWMHALQNNDNDVMVAFRYGMTGIFPKNNHSLGNQFMIAFDEVRGEWASGIDTILREGLDLFEQLFGYRSRTFMAPCYTWSDRIEEILSSCGINALQGAFMQLAPGTKPVRHWMGSKNGLGQRYFIRNCSFEPAVDPKADAKRCLKKIESAFRWNKPAIISSHRVNYIGSIHSDNRTRNLAELNLLLEGILNRWPDVEFMSSDQLLEISGDC